ncbi:hypothetical protein DICVIV_13373 [Dictyocaulus viviparus]|uniref:Uncharacterized protein n=1 Tax=Dictyocaulus viviparus TaxID=29172 RepID=A0A0D8X7Z8_DICVI|nr:hypothetical protein DICVIV_13373 [Dictyocaulus viviparus]
MILLLVIVVVAGQQIHSSDVYIHSKNKRLYFKRFRSTYYGGYYPAWNFLGSGSAWAAGGGVLGNALSFLIG